MQSWADITDDGELILDWRDVQFFSQKFDRGYRNYESALGKMISIIQREAWERGYHEGVIAQDNAKLLFLTGGHG
jgi:hypothetical protein